MAKSHVMVYAYPDHEAAGGVNDLVACVEENPDDFVFGQTWKNEVIVDVLHEAFDGKLGKSNSSPDEILIAYPANSGRHFTVEIWRFEVRFGIDTPLSSIILRTGKALHCFSREVWSGKVIARPK